MHPIDQPVDSAADATALYDTLERTVVPLYYQRRSDFVDVMRYAVALNGSFFTAQRMLQEYMIKAYSFEQADLKQAPASNLPAALADQALHGAPA